jgi:hypothetical protein
VNALGIDSAVDKINNQTQKGFDFTQGKALKGMGNKLN